MRLSFFSADFDRKVPPTCWLLLTATLIAVSAGPAACDRATPTAGAPAAAPSPGRPRRSRARRDRITVAVPGGPTAHDGRVRLLAAPGLQRPAAGRGGLRGPWRTAEPSLGLGSPAGTAVHQNRRRRGRADRQISRLPGLRQNRPTAGAPPPTLPGIVAAARTAHRRTRRLTAGTAVTGTIGTRRRPRSGVASRSGSSRRSSRRPSAAELWTSGLGPQCHLAPGHRRGPGGRVLVVGHDVTNLSDGTGGPQDAEILSTPKAISAALPGLRIEQTGRVTRPVTNDNGAIDAIDSLFVSQRR